MPTFIPISINLPIRVGPGDVVDVSWQQRGLVALFSFWDNNGKPQAVRITFAGKIIVMRIIDEMTSSLEEGKQKIGITRDSFAYEVTDSLFLRTVTEVPNRMYGNPKQYTFLGQNYGLDIIASNPPQFELIDLRPWLTSMGL